MKIQIYRKDDYVSVWNLSKSEIADADRLVIFDKNITIRFDYPCDKTEFEFTNKKGFTNWTLYECIQDGYERIYAKPKKYGVWGHDIEDLVIDEIKYNPKKKRVTLFIGS